MEKFRSHLKIAFAFLCYCGTEENFVVCLFFGIMENAIYFKFEFAKTFFIIVVHKSSAPSFHCTALAFEPIFAKEIFHYIAHFKLGWDCFMIILRIVYR